MAIKIEGVRMDKAVTIAFLTLLLFYLSFTMFTLARCQPIERDIEIDCKWKGEPVSANLKWTEPTEDTTKITNTDSSSKTSKSVTTQNNAINTQQALMLTGASAGAALVGGGLLVKKKLEGSISSDQETKQTSSTSSTSLTAPKYTSDSARSYREGLEPHQDELKSSQGSSAQTQSSTPSQTSTQTQNLTKDNGPPPTAGQQYMQRQMSSQSSQQSQPTTAQIQQLEQTNVQTSASTLVASTATITKDLLMQKQMDSLTAKSASSTVTQTGGTQKSKQISSSTPQNLGLLASSSYSAAQIAAEMWPQRQKEFEQLAKQRAELAEKFSIPSYSTGLSLASSFISATGNAWAKLHDFGSALGNGLAKVGSAIKPYSKYIMPIVVAVVVVASIFLLPPAAPTVAGAGMTGLGISVGQGAGLVGAGILVGGMGLYAAHNTIMTYPQQPNFEAQHTQYIQQPTSEIKDEKGSGTYGADPAQEQLDQADIAKGSLTQGEKHEIARQKAEEWLKELDEPILHREKAELDPENPGKKLSQYGYPDITTKHYIMEVKLGEEYELTWSKDQYGGYMQLAERVGKRLVYWFLRHPDPGSRWWQIIHELEENGIIVDFGDGGNG